MDEVELGELADVGFVALKAEVAVATSFPLVDVGTALVGAAVEMVVAAVHDGGKPDRVDETGMVTAECVEAAVQPCSAVVNVATADVAAVGNVAETAVEVVVEEERTLVFGENEAVPAVEEDVPGSAVGPTADVATAVADAIGSGDEATMCTTTVVVVVVEGKAFVVDVAIAEGDAASVVIEDDGAVDVGVNVVVNDRTLVVDDVAEAAVGVAEDMPCTAVDDNTVDVAALVVHAALAAASGTLVEATIVVVVADIFTDAPDDCPVVKAPLVVVAVAASATLVEATVVVAVADIAADVPARAVVVKATVVVVAAVVAARSLVVVVVVEAVLDVVDETPSGPVEVVVSFTSRRAQ